MCIAKNFGERRGIGYGARRDAGVPAAVLQRAYAAWSLSLETPVGARAG